MSIETIQMLDRCLTGAEDLRVQLQYTVLTVTIVVYADDNIDSKYTNQIRLNFTFLLKHIDLAGSGLVSVLYQTGVIEAGEKEFIETGEGAVCQTEMLLSVLSGKKTDQFLVGLNQTGQQHVANVLRGEAVIELSGNIAIYSKLLQITLIRVDCGEG